jgi:reverse gyrase
MALSKSDLLVVMEAARIALADADIFDDLAAKMDIADSELKRIQEALWQELMTDFNADRGIAG